MKPGYASFAVYANVNFEERQIVKAAAFRAGLSLSEFVRSCINDRLAEGDGPLLRERRHWRTHGSARRTA